MQSRFHSPSKSPFTAEERDRVTLLYGGLTVEHERMIAAAFRGNGYICQPLPQPDRSAHELGKEYCSNNLCNPVYFTVGSLLAYLRNLEQAGMSRAAIVRDYIYVTAASGGPCRFGMYEAEFRAALEAAGYKGFRILLFMQDHGIKAKTGHSALQFTVDVGLDAMDAIVLADILNDIRHRLHAYEAVPGSADETLERIRCDIERYFLGDKSFELSDRIPSWLAARLATRRQSRLYRFPNTLGKIRTHLWGNALTDVLEYSREHFDNCEVDWLKVRPVVKVIGEFWAQMTETDGNFRMFEFLEREGAEVAAESLSTWLMYLMAQAKARLTLQHRVQVATAGSRGLKRVLPFLRYMGRSSLFAAGQHLYEAHYQRLSSSLGMRQKLLSQSGLARIAMPYYNRFLRGGEGHLEVAKSLYYTTGNHAHMVLALKPFGCLPSMQSDAVQAALVDRFPTMTFLSVETSADGEIHAYSRVQMALAEARAKAADEFRNALHATGRELEELKEFIAARPPLRHALYPIPTRKGIVSTAANFVFHLDDLIRERTRMRGLSRPAETTGLEVENLHRAREARKPDLARAGAASDRLSQT